ncbi:MAG TPA: hypothetical protein PLD12_07530 [Bacteroidales bacterium]|nr:hypothetical protein [Bacteroidales bacterium]HOK98976.1 hypothetical protein [Bacteroidales bacterium]HPO65809.1 hypothetical protein [Bacteroidales bacterium]
MANFIFSLFMGIVVLTLLVVYVVYLIEWMKLPFRNIWLKILAYLLITLVPVLGLVMYKYSKKWFVRP